jgi:hypothetical protein
MCEPFARTDLRDEAIVEAARATFERGVRARQLACDRTIVCSNARRRLRRGVQRSCVITLVYLASLEDAAGQSVEEVAVAMRGFGPPPSSTTRAGLREWVARFTSRHHFECRERVEARVRIEITRATRLHRQTHASMASRDRALSRHLPSTAQRLVQAGLFDGRALRRAETRQKVAVLLRDESDQHVRRADARRQLILHVKLVAVRVCG